MKRLITIIYIAALFVVFLATIGMFVYHTYSPREMIAFLTSRDWEVSYRPALLTLDDHDFIIPGTADSTPTNKMARMLLYVLVTNNVTKSLHVDSVRIFQVSTGYSLGFRRSGFSYDFPSDLRLEQSNGYWIYNQATVRISMEKCYYSTFLQRYTNIDTLSLKIFDNKDVAIEVYTDRGNITIPVRRYYVTSGMDYVVKEIRD
ncbi:MAG: hypothetical protein HZB59_12175 [Ignavibacteriales bacterium]|nr:hypothetical protein [Ignavibacteriales bacterium]